jgi:hypothetical protein
MSKPLECEEAVIEKIRARRHAGRRKYGVSMERTDLTKLDWLRHAQEEALDFAIYLEKLIQADSTPHPEATCEECGRENVTWFAPSKLWNKVCRANRGSTADPMLCPVCFIKRAEAAGYNGQTWKVAPEFYDSPNCGNG